MRYERWAHLYDDLVSEEEDVPFFLELAGSVGEGKVAELMAGTGRVALPLAAAGVDLTCVDSSPAMLEVLRGKLAAAELSARVVEQDVAALDLGERFSLLLIAFNSFEELVEDEVRERALASIRRHLAPGGRAVITLHDPRAGGVDQGRGERQIERSFVERATGKQVLLRHSARRSGNLWSGNQSLRYAEEGAEIVSLPVCYRLCGREEFERLAADAGLGVAALYGDFQRGAYVEGESARMIWLLRRSDEP